MAESASGATATNRLTGGLLVLVAAVMWSTSGLFAKSPFFDNWPVDVDGWIVRGPLFAFWRALFAGVVLIPLIRRPRWTPKLIPMVLIFAVMNVTFLTAVTQTTAANAIWLQHTAPAWVFLVGLTLLGEQIQRRDWWLLGFALLGVGFILVFETQGESLGGVLFGLAAGLTYAGVVLSLRWLRDEDSAWLIALNHVVTAVLIFPYVVLCDIWPSTQQVAILAGFGIIQMGVPYWLFARGIKSIASHEASGIVLLEPVLVPVWVYVAWHHHATYQAPDWWTFVGGGLILTGLLCRYLGIRRTRQNKTTNAK